MKIAEKDFGNFLKTGLAAVSTVLIYGPDSGKNDEFVSKIIDAQKISTDNLIESDGVGFRDRYDAIFADACSASMFGGDKLVVIRNPDGRDLSLIQNLVESAIFPVVITAAN